jgi:hypothetical protein
MRVAYTIFFTQMSPELSGWTPTSHFWKMSNLWLEKVTRGGVSSKAFPYPPATFIIINSKQCFVRRLQAAPIRRAVPWVNEDVAGK